MKKLLTLIIVLWCSAAWAVEPLNIARTNPYVAGAGVAAAAQTAYCTAANACANLAADHCDQACEDFDSGSTDCDGAGAGTDANCERSYTVTIASGDSIDFVAAPSGSYPCTGTTNTNVAQVVMSAANKTTYFTSTGSNGTSGYYQFYVNVTSSSLNTSTGYMRMFQVTNTSSNDVAILRVQGVSGALKFNFCVWNGTDITTLCANAGTGSVTTGTWYRVRISLDTGTTTAKLYVGDTEEVSHSGFNASNARTPGKWMVGQGGANNTAAITWQIDNIAWDDDTLPSACN